MQQQCGAFVAGSLELSPDSVWKVPQSIELSLVQGQAAALHRTESHPQPPFPSPLPLLLMDQCDGLLVMMRTNRRGHDRQACGAFHHPVSLSHSHGAAAAAAIKRSHPLKMLARCIGLRRSSIKCRFLMRFSICVTYWLFFSFITRWSVHSA
jgi:hypothetical protein